MYRLASFLAFLIVGFCVVGYFRGWLAVQTTPTGPDGKVNINVTVDRVKLRSDVEAAKHAVKSGVDTMKKEFDENKSSSGAPSTSNPYAGDYNYTGDRNAAPPAQYDNVRYR